LHRFDTIAECDRQADTQTDVLTMAKMRKNGLFDEIGRNYVLTSGAQYIQDG